MLPYGRPAYSGQVRRSFATRYLAVGVLFVLVLFVYLCRLWSLQTGDRDTFFTYSEDNTTYYTVVVKADRGAICDRNGRVLVYDRQINDLIFDYNAMPSDNDGINGMILHAMNALRRSGNSDRLVTDVLFPFDGVYPDYTPKTVLADETSEETAKLIQFLDFRGLSREATLRMILNKMLTKYGLVDKAGELRYTPEETHQLLVTRYDMESKGFGAYQPYTLAQDVDLFLMAYLKESPYPGAEVTQTSQRVYNYPGYASHILGQVSRIYAEDWDYYREKGYQMTDLAGVSGCEAAFEDWLRGQDGQMRIYVDEDGQVVRMEMTREPKRGYDVWLTIDIDLQMAAEQALAENVANIRAASDGEGTLTGEDCNAGAVVATDPNTGEVLVLASYPTFDLTTFGKDYPALAADASLPLFDRALEGTYAPGSTFKPGVALAALSEGIITPQTIINTKGIYTYYETYHPRCWLYLSTGMSHGPINVTEAIRVSCNYFFYDVGRQLGITAMNRYGAMYGLGEKTGIELPESCGILAGPAYRDANGLSEWLDEDTLSAAIGQSDNLFTPLQICQYAACLTNGGVRYGAHLLYRVMDFGAEEPVYQSEATVKATFSLDETYLAAVREGMRQVITNGTSAALRSYFRSLPVTVGGKTGTAQVRSTESDNGVFMCVAPLEAPQIAVTVLVERAGGGSAVAYTAGKLLETFFGVDAVG